FHGNCGVISAACQHRWLVACCSRSRARHASLVVDQRAHLYPFHHRRDSLGSCWRSCFLFFGKSSDRKSSAVLVRWALRSCSDGRLLSIVATVYGGLSSGAAFLYCLSPPDDNWQSFCGLCRMWRHRCRRYYG